MAAGSTVAGFAVPVVFKKGAALLWGVPGSSVCLARRSGHCASGAGSAVRGRLLRQGLQWGHGGGGCEHLEESVR